ncbi:hypothetical protein TTMY_2302 [Thermus thermophilus]|nr:hypothetical protein TTMY_2302 [Thermus thermophilus]
MAHHAQDVGVVDDAVGVGHAHVGVGLVVVGDEDELKAQGLEPLLRLLHGELRPQLDLLPKAAWGPERGDWVAILITLVCPKAMPSATAPATRSPIFLIRDLLEHAFALRPYSKGGVGGFVNAPRKVYS